MPPLVKVYRGGYLESFHSGAIAVVDSLGRLLAVTGDAGLTTFLRSAAKPFQCLPLLVEGGAEEFDLTGEEIALICGSHGGEPIHVSTAAAILRKGDFDEQDLLCGRHMPYDEKASAELRQSGEEPSVLHNNCSGKHAGMLLATRLLDAPSATYTDPGHPLQQAVRKGLAEFAGLEANDIAQGTDGCGVPSYYMALYRAAFAYARLAATSTSEEAPGALPRYADPARRIFEAMTSFPQYVAGNWSITTPLMRAFSGKLLAKEGAEGFYSMAVAPELAARLTDRLRLGDDCAVGIALKISDGSMARGRNPVILKTLEIVGAEASGSDLARFGNRQITNNSGRVVGEIRAEFELEFL
jgi:L-asparaginase II